LSQRCNQRTKEHAEFQFHRNLNLLQQTEPREGKRDHQQWGPFRHAARCAAQLQQSKANFHPVFFLLQFPN